MCWLHVLLCLKKITRDKKKIYIFRQLQFSTFLVFPSSKPILQFFGTLRKHFMELPSISFPNESPWPRSNILLFYMRRLATACYEITISSWLHPPEFFFNSKFIWLHSLVHSLERPPSSFWSWRILLCTRLYFPAKF